LLILLHSNSEIVVNAKELTEKINKEPNPAPSLRSLIKLTFCCSIGRLIAEAGASAALAFLGSGGRIKQILGDELHRDATAILLRCAPTCFRFVEIKKIVLDAEISTQDNGPSAVRMKLSTLHSS
jgi:hypothetical protein